VLTGIGIWCWHGLFGPRSPRTPPIVALCAALFVMGLAWACTMMPTMTAAIQTLDPRTGGARFDA